MIHPYSTTKPEKEQRNPEHSLEERLYQARLYYKAGYLPLPACTPSCDRHPDDPTSRGKVPHVKKFKELASRAVSWGHLENLFKWHWGIGNRNMANILKPGQIVPDIDARSGGVESWERLCDEYPEVAKACYAAPTVRSGSGNGSKHIYMKLPPDVQVGGGGSLNDVGFPGVEYKSFGGLVIAPGSLHLSGGIYEAEFEADLHESEAPLIPSPLLSLIFEAKAASGDNSGSRQTSNAGGFSKYTSDQALEFFKRNYGPGDRRSGQGLPRLAALNGRRGVCPDCNVGILLEWQGSHFTPPLDPEALEHHVREVCQRYGYMGETCGHETHWWLRKIRNLIYPDLQASKGQRVNNGINNLYSRIDTPSEKSSATALLQSSAPASPSGAWPEAPEGIEPYSRAHYKWLQGYMADQDRQRVRELNEKLDEMAARGEDVGNSIPYATGRFTLTPDKDIPVLREKADIYFPEPDEPPDVKWRYSGYIGGDGGTHAVKDLLLSNTYRNEANVQMRRRSWFMEYLPLMTRHIDKAGGLEKYVIPLERIDIGKTQTARLLKNYRERVNRKDGVLRCFANPEDGVLVVYSTVRTGIEDSEWIEDPDVLEGDLILVLQKTDKADLARCGSWSYPKRAVDGHSEWAMPSVSRLKMAFLGWQDTYAGEDLKAGMESEITQARGARIVAEIASDKKVQERAPDFIKASIFLDVSVHRGEERYRKNPALGAYLLLLEHILSAGGHLSDAMFNDHRNKTFAALPSGMQDIIRRHEIDIAPQAKPEKPARDAGTQGKMIDLAV